MPAGAPDPLLFPQPRVRGYTDQVLDDGPAATAGGPALRDAVRAQAAGTLVRKAPVTTQRSKVIDTDRITANGTLDPVGTGPMFFPPYTPPTFY